MKQIFLREDGILTYLAFAATADGKKVYLAYSVYNIVSFIDTATNTVIAEIIFLQLDHIYNSFLARLSLSII